MQNNIGLIGLAVMGQNITRNIANNGYKISVYNRTPQVTKDFVSNLPSPNISPFYDIENFVTSLESPKKILLMIQAGNPIDVVIEQLLPYLHPGDSIVDLGNSFYKDTQRRYDDLKEKNIAFFGCGVSGGELGALHGPSMMPGGEKDIYSQYQKLFQDISATDFSQGKCVTYIGNGGSGHFVKMIHNGIEYAIMQMMAEVYDLLRKNYSLNAPQISEIFQMWNQGKLNSYLFEIAQEVLQKQDDLGGDGYLIDKILDVAGSKGTGLWSSIESLEENIPTPAIIASTLARHISEQKPLRITLAGLYNFHHSSLGVDIQDFTKKAENALYLAMILSYAQGLHLIQTTSKKYNWGVNLSEVVRIWQGGCIIRSKLLLTLQDIYKKQPDIEHLLIDTSIAKDFNSYMGDFQDIVEMGVKTCIATPSLSSNLSYWYQISTFDSGAKFIQALRDNFGAHTYKRVDKDGNFHSSWSL